MINFLLTFENFIHTHSAWGVPASMAGGILIALSPCILPILPVTVSIIGEAELATKMRGSYLSFIFVLGVTVTYVTLGVIASLFGIFLSRMISAFWVNAGMGILFILLGLSFFDLFHFSFFNVSYKPRRTILSIFILGLITGFSMIPCAFPVLGTILSIISVKQNVLYGIFCLFAFSVGYGLILGLAGSSATLITRLSKKKHWFIIIKRGLGLILVSIGFFFLSRLIFI